MAQEELWNRSSIRLRYGSPPDHPESTGWSACAKEPGIRREMKPENPDAELTFGEALRLSVPAERAAYLDQACGGNQAFRQKMESLLSAHAQAGDFLNQTRPLPASDVLIERTGTMVGRYKLLEQIGEGGFGVVWMAEQEEPVRRRVALKIIKLGMDSKEVVARFDAERQALAIMDHPNIATVFDGGTTDTGRPYFVMELVKGIPITEYCDANLLSTRERLELFIQVCHAVQHAHQKGVIHRDLKPSNILVTVKDEQPMPKIIDFGVAKATQARLTEKTLFTGLRQWIGTPAYMSPEQAGLGSLDVDTRNDIYSLGVLLYELLTGQTPFDFRKLLERGTEAIMRTIREEEPRKPSPRLSTLSQDELRTIAAKRHAAPAKLSRLLRGDLDWVTMRALEKVRSRRYETANAFARDIEHCLRAEPVSAIAPSAAYYARKFIRRHKAGLAIAGGMTLLLIASVMVSALGWLEAALARDTEAQLRVQAEALVVAETKARLEAEDQRERLNAALRDFTTLRADAFRHACVANLLQLDGAKAMWALNHRKGDTDTPTAAELKEYLSRRKMVVCPAGGTYTIGSMKDAPTCSVQDHKLE